MFAGLRPISFLAPVYLWMLLLPAALLALWMWRVAQRGGDLRRLRESRFTPVPERWSRWGDLLFWLCLVLASAALTVALARPRTVAPGVGRAGLDVIILQDGSASMLVNDMAAGTRWARSMTFLRRFGDALRWEGDRMALTVFARIAAPQVRLTRDPNTVFFFLDHLDQQSPFRLED
ncbi:MAG: hypothetical protein IT178_16305, partial [Acidobacteria bacterium]|nr:hypothetical protein [Acidobacteriota bacterium]